MHSSSLGKNKSQQPAWHQIMAKKNTLEYEELQSQRAQGWQHM